MKTILLALFACLLPPQVTESRWNYLPMRGQEFTGLVFTFENLPVLTATVDLWATVDGDPVHEQRTFKINRNRSNPRAACIEMNLGRDPLRFHMRRVAIIIDGRLWMYAEPLAGRFYSMQLD